MGVAERINPQEIIGNQYGKWTVVDYVEKKGPHHLFKCRCECGNERVIPLNNLKRGLSRSCGMCRKPEIVEEDNHYRYICTNGESFLFDAEDFEEVVQHHWSIGKIGYPVCEEHGKKIYLHRILLDVEDGVCVDHINGNKCDNRRKNLRASTQQQNVHNSAMKVNNTSGYKGVSFHKQAGKFEAYIYLDYKRHYLGLFQTAEEAALARDEAARELHGEFACVNFPLPGEQGCRERAAV